MRALVLCAAGSAGAAQERAGRTALSEAAQQVETRLSAAAEAVLGLSELELLQASKREARTRQQDPELFALRSALLRTSVLLGHLPEPLGLGSKIPATVQELLEAMSLGKKAREGRPCPCWGRLGRPGVVVARRLGVHAGVRLPFAPSEGCSSSGRAIGIALVVVWGRGGIRVGERAERTYHVAPGPRSCLRCSSVR